MSIHTLLNLECQQVFGEVKKVVVACILYLWEVECVSCPKSHVTLFAFTLFRALRRRMKRVTREGNQPLERFQFSCLWGVGFYLRRISYVVYHFFL